MANNRKKGQQDTPESVQKTTKGRLNKMELTGIGLFLLTFLIYLVNKCSSDETLPPEDAIVIEMTTDSTEADTAATALPLQRTGSSFSDGTSRNKTSPPKATSNKNNSSGQKLYVSIDSSKMRSAPRLDSLVVSYLRYGDEVINLGEQTELQRIRVSADEVRTAPWIKIKTKTGQIGWTYGACLQFYPVPASTGSRN
jgi:hypothetical protein